jgi:Ser/Thr protein kinase RdoA (MazF antagonist)
VIELPPGEPGAESALGDGQFPALARAIGATFSELPCADVEIDDMWARPRYLAARADTWAAECLAPVVSAELGAVLADLPALFDGRPGVPAHGDYAPANILVRGETITGLLDFEFVRVADPLYDAARWAWSVGLMGAGVLAAAWTPFLEGRGVDPAAPLVAQRIRSMPQVMRTLEMLAAADLAPGLWRVAHERLAGPAGEVRPSAPVRADLPGPTGAATLSDGRRR